MSGLATVTRTWGVVFVVAVTALVAMRLAELHQTILAVAAAIAWLAALLALRPLVTKDRLTYLYFAFGIMAFLVFFLHETYGYHGKVRYFPLLVGWTGVVLSILDILSLTETRIARVINTFFGATHVPTEQGGTLQRELACVIAMSAGVGLVWLVGFLIAAPIFVFLWMWRWGGKSMLTSLYGGVFTFAFIWVLFEALLSYELYRGELVLWLLDQIQA